MRVNVLGPLQVLAEDGAPVEVRGKRLRWLLMRLAVEPGTVVAPDRLIADLWPDEPPVDGAAALQSLVSRLRRVLGAAAISSHATGYRLEAETDAEVFARTRDAALWRGAAFEEAPFAADEAVRLALLRDDLAGLEALAAAHPLREDVQARLMLALNAAGRRSDALAVFARVRTALADELGVDPGEALAAAHLTVLRERVARGNLPAPVGSFVGRGADLAALGSLLRDNRLVTLTGFGGVGKTRLALTHAASEPQAWFVELDSAADPLAALDAALGPNPLAAPVFSRLGSSLVVLDNCEHVVDAAAALCVRLLAEAPDARVLATSREPLGIPGEVVCPVAPLDLDHAVRLFSARVGTALDADVVRRVCAALEGIPLALELAAARARSLSAAQLESRVDSRLRLLDRGARTGPARHRTLRAVIDWSWDLLDEAERALLARLAVFVGGATAAAVHEVCGADLDADAAGGVAAASVGAARADAARVDAAGLEAAGLGGVAAGVADEVGGASSGRAVAGSGHEVRGTGVGEASAGGVAASVVGEAGGPVSGGAGLGGAAAPVMSEARRADSGGAASAVADEVCGAYSEAAAVSGVAAAVVAAARVDAASLNAGGSSGASLDSAGSGGASLDSAGSGGAGLGARGSGGEGLDSAGSGGAGLGARGSGGEGLDFASSGAESLNAAGSGVASLGADGSSGPGLDSAALGGAAAETAYEARGAGSRRGTPSPGTPTSQRTHEVRQDRDLWDTEDLLAALVEKSLVVRSGERYRLLETVREYASEQGQSDHKRHAAYYVALAERYEPLLRGPRQLEALQVFDAERANMDAAMAWAVGNDVGVARRMMAARTWHWLVMTKRFEEIRRWAPQVPGDALSEVLAALGTPQAVVAAERLWQEEVPTALCALMLTSGQIWGVRELGDRFALLAERLERSPDEWMRAFSALVRGVVAGEFSEGALPEAEAQYRRALERFRAVGDRWAVVFGLSCLVMLLINRGAFAEGFAAVAEAREVAEELGEPESVLVPMSVLVQTARLKIRIGDLAGAGEDLATVPAPAFALDRGRIEQAHAEIAFFSGDFEEAVALYRRALDATAGSRASQFRATVHAGLGLALTRLGRLREAGEEHRRALGTVEESADGPARASVLEAYADWLLAQGDPAGAGNALDEAGRLRGGPSSDPAVVQLRDRVRAEVRVDR
ncbi:BTAD domain-containing putative transcriptional regulator [Lentzea sp. NEAU-D7]|uniref:BTAD domain-containing putative transcriptional regulator n=1 Tax=Lentzea sp. NEAU-D7 TaxID=2994667 RepID=UPI00224B7AF3|nr:BTAD domain-containing putative transcriptional regulator [Lentzea sp. NEAU-D7]MCX2947708.1 BTAD domain-containing putative transcriptional regulator [Lentzea sp. NEAU-D7]